MENQPIIQKIASEWASLIDNEEIRNKIVKYHDKFSSGTWPADRLSWCINFIGCTDGSGNKTDEGDEYWIKITSLINLFGNVGDGNVNISREPIIKEVEVIKEVAKENTSNIAKEWVSAINYISQDFTTQTGIVSNGKKYTIYKQ